MKEVSEEAVGESGRGASGADELLEERPCRQCCGSLSTVTAVCRVSVADLLVTPASLHTIPLTAESYYCIVLCNRADPPVVFLQVLSALLHSFLNESC